MSDEPTKFEERMFDQIKVDEDKPPMPYEDCFQQGMGTELMAPLLYSLIRFVRPQRILEIGLGYTTPWLIKGLEDNEQIHIDGNADMDYFGKPYDPKIIFCITGCSKI
jgi:predicted O-methyltransferase YrrM